MLDGDVTDAVEARSLGLNNQHIDIYSARYYVYLILKNPQFEFGITAPGILLASIMKLIVLIDLSLNNHSS